MEHTAWGARLRRNAAVTVAAAVVVGGLSTIGVHPAAAAQDTSWTPAAGATPTTATYAYVVSAAGDYIGAGKTYAYTPVDTDITVTTNGGRISVGIAGDQSWSATFQPPSGVTTVVDGAVYTDLTRYPGNVAAVGGLTFGGEGRGCNQLVGWYAIDDATYSGSTLQTLTLRFEQRCENAAAAPLRGQIRYDATAPIPGAPTPTLPIPALWTPTAGATPASGPYVYLSSQAGDFVGKGKSYLYTGPTDIQVDGGGALLGIDIDDGDDWWYLDAAASTRADALTAGYYPGLQRYPFHNKVRGGFSISGNGASCNKLEAWMAIDEIDQRSGNLTDLTMRFEQRCSGATPAFRGKVRWEPAPPAGTSTAPRAVEATPQQEGATVTWQAPTSNGSSAITGYEILVYERGNVTRAPIAATASARSATIDGLPVGVPHTFKVRAINGAGAGPRSDASAAVSPLSEPAPDLGPFATAAALVRQQYLDFVGRSASNAEVTAASAPLLDGTQTPGEVIAAMRLRAEWATHRSPIIRLYSAYFDRLPDASGLTYWSNKLKTGTSLSKVSATFAASSEFTRKYGALSNRGFVLLIYTNVLKRTPDAGGVSYWTGRLDKGTSRGTVMTNFSESSENKRKTANAVDVVLLTTGMLRRVPTPTELSEAIADLGAGGTIDQLATELLLGAPYAARF